MDSVFPDNDRFRKLLFSYPGKAIQFLYDFYYAGLVQLSEKLTHDRVVSEDIVQEAFVDIWMDHESLGQQLGKPLRHYLIRMVRNRSVSAYKRSLKLGKAGAAYKHQLRNNDGETPETQLIVDEIQRQVRRLISEFPCRERECFFLSRTEAMTNKQIAASLKISEKAVERSITSANKRIRRYWAIHVSD